MSYASTALLKPPEKVDSFWAVTPLLWRLGLTTTLYWLLCFGDGDMAGGFYRTIVSCDAVVPVSGKCALGTVYQDGACAPVAKTSWMWSGSAGCLDKAYVMNEATKFGGRVTAARGVVGLILSVVIGASMVDSVGRKPVLLLCIACLTIFSLLNCIACQVPKFAHLLIYLGAFCAALSGTFVTASVAMAADIMPNDVNARGIAYSFLHALRSVGIVLGFAVGFFVLRANFTDYTLVFLASTLISVLVLLIASLSLVEVGNGRAISEAAPLNKVKKRGIEAGGPGDVDSIEGGGHGNAMGTAGRRWNPLKELLDAFAIVWRDPFLRYSLISGFLGSMTTAGAVQLTGPFAVTTVKLTVSVASLAGVSQPFCMCIGAVLASLLIPKIGPFYTSYAAGFFIAVGYIVVGLAAYFPASAAEFYWIGWSAIVGTGYGLGAPSGLAVSCMRVDSSLHGKLFAVQGFIGTDMLGIGGIVGSYVWSNIFFDGKFTQGWHAAEGFFIAAAISVLTTCFSIWLYVIYVLPEKHRDAERIDVDAAENVVAPAA